MALQGNPPPQNYGNPQPGNFYVGHWLFYGPPFNRYFWEGNGPVGYVGGPATYTYIPYPGTNQFPWLPAPATPPAQTPQTPPPPPAPPATGVPAQSNPPITGDHRDDPRKSACGPAMAVPKESGVDGDYGADGGKYCGYGADDALGVPVVAAMHSLPVHTTATWLDTDTPNKYISYDRHPYLKKDELGRYSAVHNGMASGIVVFAPPQIQDFHCYGDSTLRDSQWPVRISSSTFLLFNGASAGIASFAKTYLAFGTAHPTSVKPKLGWYFDLTSNTLLTLADTLSLVPTKSDATDITDPSDYPTFDIKADARVRGKLTVDGLIDPTGLVLTEQAASPWVAVAGYGTLYVKNTAPSTLIFVDDTGAETTLGSGGSGLGDPGGNGIVVRTALNTTTNRTLTGSGLATISNGDGVGGNPTVIVPAASTTEQLTGTDATKAATPDSVAALWEQGADIASANTISVGEGGYFNVTGTTDISDIDFATDKAGRKVWLKFTDSVEIAHNASTLILPTGANITTAAGDTACFISEGADAVRCVVYQRADGSSLAGGAGPATQLDANGTTLDVDAIADGEFLVRSGTSIIGSAGGGGGISAGVSAGLNFWGAW